MQSRRLEALALAMLTACASAPRFRPESTDPDEAELNADHYELRVVTTEQEDIEPVEVDEDDFQETMAGLAREVRPSEQPQETARWLMEEGLRADLFAEVERGRVVRMVPLEEDSPLSIESNAHMVALYKDLCAQEYAGGDCLGLLANGPVLDREDRRTLGLHFAFGSVLQETRDSLQEMVNPQAVMALVVGAAGVYLMLWLLPEPVSKGVAVLLTVSLIAWLGAQTVWELMNGWAQLVQETDRATTFEQIEEAGRRYGQVMGENTARVLVMLVTTALSGGAARFAPKLPKLPGFERAAVQAETQAGVELAGR